MRKTKLTIAVLIFIALFGFKYIFPEQSSRIISGVASLFDGDIDYRSAFSRLGEAIAVFDDEEDTNVLTQQVLRPDTAAAGTAETALLTDAASNLGERQSVTEAVEEELPAVVSTFLESQAEFSDYALPDRVTYDYLKYPESHAIPVAGYNSSGFGYRLHPIHGDVRFHYGTDFAAWTGESILAFGDGTVSFAGYSDSFGNYITIDHADGWRSLYAHCSVLYVSAGDAVTAGQLIALVGDTGLVTGPHLHFELTHDGVYVNPEYYVNS